MDEKDILSKIRSNWPALNLITIESTTGNGIPDTNFCYQGLDVWMELKLLRGDGQNIYCEKFQPQFHVTRNRAGGLSIIFAADRHEIKVLRMVSPYAPRKGTPVGDKLKFDTTDPLVFDQLIQWSRPFKWKEMFVQFMEVLKQCRQTS